MEVKKIEVGSKVKWVSQSQGSVKEKAGIVHAVVEAGANAMSLLPTGIVSSQIKFDTWRSLHKRYIIAVPRGGKSQKIDYYCPRVGDLQLRND
ncbi:hypothetical protein SD70_29615 [Gordoniibacillus kamchatkensis]|uniref:Uncharacterized protein n=2 Tax=Gordoniibacillus kamchatkensis TaxID=1590651 RepID=A0ABR5AA67_9BACL|nr:hypothetical protein SD70_29615 [Paenibacillus sp. VKM B-2647]